MGNRDRSELMQHKVDTLFNVHTYIQCTCTCISNDESSRLVKVNTYYYYFNSTQLHSAMTT